MHSPPQTIELDRGKASASSRRRRIDLNTRVVPGVRGLALMTLCAVIFFYNLGIGDPAQNATLPIFLAVILVYSLGSWWLLRSSFERLLPFDLGMVFLTTDLFFHAWAIYLTGGEASWLVLLMVFRTADQVSAGSRRTLFFAHVSTAVYALLIAYLAFVEGRAVAWPTELMKIALLYAGNLYIALTAKATDARSQQASEAVHLARGLIEDLEDRTEELEESRRLAEAGSLAKSQFLTNISHELRTPMNAISGLLDLMIVEHGDRTLRHQVRKLRSSAYELSEVIDDLLDFSRLEADEIFLEKQPTDPRRVVRGTVKRLKHRAVLKALEIETEFAQDLPPWIEADPVRLRQVLLQLLDNAIKFTETGRVTLRVETDPSSEDHLIFSVLDTGVGFGDGPKDHLLEPFTQRDGSLTRRHGGVGLGLALSQRLINLMGGTLEVENAPGGGAIVRFRLEAPAIDKPLPHSYTETLEVASASILVVEDNPLNQEVMVAMLESLGLRVAHADDGGEALEVLRKAPFDLVLMDCQMPGMDGYQATRELRRREGSREHTPVIAVTAHAMEGDRERCLAAGMDDFLPKPVTLDSLAGAVSRWIEIGG
ncbi:MAG: response regulator [Acidobacteriota bacterium]